MINKRIIILLISNICTAIRLGTIIEGLEKQSNDFKYDLMLCEKQNSIIKHEADIIAKYNIEESVLHKFEYCFGQAKIMPYTGQEARYHDFLLCSTNLR